MKCKGIVSEDIVNYKKISMFIIFPSCTFKCGRKECQNSSLVSTQNIEITIEEIINMYIYNPLTSAIVCGGLEPFDSQQDLEELVKNLREVTQDDIVIYTGYTEEELLNNPIFNYNNIIVKFGRYLPNQESHYDEILGVKLSSPNQYAKRMI